MIEKTTEAVLLEFLAFLDLAGELAPVSTIGEDHVIVKLFMDSRD